MPWAATKALIWESIRTGRKYLPSSEVAYQALKGGRAILNPQRSCSRRDSGHVWMTEVWRESAFKSPSNRGECIMVTGSHFGAFRIRVLQGSEWWAAFIPHGPGV